MAVLAEHDAARRNTGPVLRMTEPDMRRWISETVELAWALPFTSGSARALADRCLSFADPTAASQPRCLG